MTSTNANQVVCPRCGEVRLETPPGTTALPTLGMVRKTAGAAGVCDCGRAPHERPGDPARERDPSEPSDRVGPRRADAEGA